MTTANTARSGRRTRMSPEARRDQLIALGMAMVDEKPLDQVTIDAIAEVAGVSRALLFHYFASKQDFHLAILRAQGEQLIACTTPDDSLDDPIAILTSSLSAFVDYVSEHGGAYTAFLRGSSSADPAVREAADATRSVMVDRVLEHAPAFGLEVTPRARVAVSGWVTFVEEVTISWLTDPDVMTRDELLDLICNSLPAIALSVGGALPER